MAMKRAPIQLESMAMKRATIQLLLVASCLITRANASFAVLAPSDYAPFLRDDRGNHTKWAIDNIPFFDHPNAELLQVYYFR